MNDRAIKRQAQKEIERRAHAINNTISALMEHEQGRDFLWWLMEISKVGHQPFATNALVTSFQCGELNVGQQILARIIEANPAGYVRLLQEREDARRSRAADRDADTGGDPDY